MNPRHRRSPKNLTVNDVYDLWYEGGGVFSYLSSLSGDRLPPWDLETNIGDIDIAYHGTHSGNKFVGPVVYHLMEDGELTGAGKTQIAAALYARYYPKWQHLWDLYHLEYNPIDNYHVEDSGTDTVTESGETSHTRTPSLTKTVTHPIKTVDSSETRTPDLTEETVTDETIGTGLDATEETTHGHVIGTQEAGTDNVSNSRFGFNSAEAVPTESSTETKSRNQTESHSGKDTVETDSSETVDRDGTVTKTNTGTEEVETTVTETYTGIDQTAEGGTDTTEGETSLTRETEYGHVKTGTLYQVPANMMDADRAFWLEDYFAIVFDDIDAFLTLSIYSEKPVKHKVFTD